MRNINDTLETNNDFIEANDAETAFIPIKGFSNGSFCHFHGI